MSLRDEITGYLHQVARPGPQRARNIALVQSYYGFGDDTSWPTLDGVGKRFGVGTRERVRQILNADFRVAARAEHLTKLQAAARLLSSRSLWQEQAFRAALEDAVGSAVGTSTAGLLALLQDTGLSHDHALYDIGLAMLSRASYPRTPVRLLISRSRIASLRTSLRRAEAAAECAGIVHTARLFELAGADQADLKIILRGDPAIWTLGDDEGFWFHIPHQDNALRRLVKKIFAVSERLRPEALAAAIDRGLRGGAAGRGRPDFEVLMAWISETDLLVQIDDEVALAGEPGELSALEAEVVRHLSQNGSSFYGPIRDHLVGMGFNESSIAKLLTLSSLVRVDRTGGRKTYRYSLAGASRRRWRELRARDSRASP